ncbi:hypothetical protein AURDEDRAFT_160119 [Auricularia subglabra TFB-10046 SS5]|nr:hypothetical protein AURDEDRAFT_160119 [Auricularia subglabra TFB-10046 SS5]
MSRLEGLPHELLILIFDYFAPYNDCEALLNLALTSRKVGDAATDVLYRVVSLTTEKQLQLFGKLILRPRVVAGAVPLLARVRSLSTEGGDLFNERLAARIIDACPNLIAVQTNAHILFDLCASRRSYRTIFCLCPGVYWPEVARPQNQSYFAHLERLHVPGLQEPFTPRTITPETFPKLRFLSAVLDTGYNGTAVSQRFVRDFIDALLPLPKLERALFFVDPKSSGHLYAIFQDSGDRRLYLAAHTYWHEYPEPEQVVWYHTMHNMHNIFHTGVPALDLEPVGSLSLPPPCIEDETMYYWVP